MPRYTDVNRRSHNIDDYADTLLGNLLNSALRNGRFEWFTGRDGRHSPMFTCAQCGQPQSAAGCQADHIVAQADGGSDELSNLQILCATCNTANMHHRATSVAGRTRGAFVARRAGRMGRD